MQQTVNKVSQNSVWRCEARGTSVVQSDRTVAHTLWLVGDCVGVAKVNKQVPPRQPSNTGRQKDVILSHDWLFARHSNGWVINLYVNSLPMREWLLLMQPTLSFFLQRRKKKIKHIFYWYWLRVYCDTYHCHFIAQPYVLLRPINPQPWPQPWS